MVKRTILALLAGVVVGSVLAPVIYYVKTAPHRAVLGTLAAEALADLERWGNTKTISKSDYDETMKRHRAREERHRQVIAEKMNIRSRAWQIAIVSGIVTGAGVFGSHSWLSKRRKPSVESKSDPDALA